MNKVMVIRRIGGLGDILMHRMMFEDFKLSLPECHLTFACPKQFHEVVSDHPFIDQVLDSEDVNYDDYAVVYDTSAACSRYEIGMAPFSGLNRSDIWAQHCGVFLTVHKMHVKLDPEMISEVKETLYQLNPEQKKMVLFTPVSAMSNKNLLPHHVDAVVKHLRDKDLFVYSTHTHNIKDFERLKVPLLRGNLKQWMSFVAAADYVVTVDTSVFHFAGGIGKPMLGIFTFTDGKAYGRHYDCITVQKHRDNGDWNCGPCYDWTRCPKSKQNPKPCITELPEQDILAGIDKMLERWRFNSLNT